MPTFAAVLPLLFILACNLAASAPLAAPDDVASCMKATPYVEQSCTSSAFPGWPYDAKDCSYTTPIGTLHVTVADAPAERVAAWVANATRTIAWTAALESAHPGAFVQVQKIMAVDVMYQRCAKLQASLSLSHSVQWSHICSQG